MIKFLTLLVLVTALLIGAALVAEKCQSITITFNPKDSK